MENKHLPVRPNIGNDKPTIFANSKDPDVQQFINSSKKVNALEMASQKTKEEIIQAKKDNANSSKSGTDSKDESKWSSWVIIGLALVVIILILIIIYYVFNYNKLTVPQNFIPEHIIKPSGSSHAPKIQTHYNNPNQINPLNIVEISEPPSNFQNSPHSSSKPKQEYADVLQRLATIDEVSEPEVDQEIKSPIESEEDDEVVMESMTSMKYDNSEMLKEIVNHDYDENNQYMDEDLNEKFMNQIDDSDDEEVDDEESD
jgi:hypothetical protein